MDQQASQAIKYFVDLIIGLQLQLASNYSAALVCVVSVGRVVASGKATVATVATLHV